MLHITLAITDFFHEIFNQYFIITVSNTITNNSQVTIYHIQFHNIDGKTNHNKGSVIVVGIIHNKRSFLFEICASSRNNFAIKNKINVSIIIAEIQNKGNFFILPKSFALPCVSS